MRCLYNPLSAAFCCLGMDEVALHISVPVRVKTLPGRPPLPLPRYATAGAAGMDLIAAEGATLKPGERCAVGTGLALEIPEGYEGQVRPRSGLALRQGITVLNAPGTIDADYRGEVKVLLINLGTEAVTLEVGDRVAQMVIAPVHRAELHLVAELDGTERGEGGFGHTGR